MADELTEKETMTGDRLRARPRSIHGVDTVDVFGPLRLCVCMCIYIYVYLLGPFEYGVCIYRYISMEYIRVASKIMFYVL